MTIDNWLVIGILVVSLVLFLIEKPRVDVVALLVLIATVFTGLVDASDAFLGFADPAVITVWAVFIVSGGLFKTGIADEIARYMVKIAGKNPIRLMVVMMIFSGIMSAFMNNIGAVAILLPAVMSISREIEVSPSKMLIPLSVASLLGGNITLIGTPPNLIAASTMVDYGGLEPFGFFDFAPTGVIVLIVGIFYMVFIGRHLLPERTSGTEIAEGYIEEEYLAEVQVTEESPLVWEKINRISFGEDYDVAIVYVRRGEEFLQQASDRRLRVGDVILLEGGRDEVETVSDHFAFDLRSQLKQDSLDEELEATGQLVEITLSPRSKFRGKTLRDLDFRGRYGVTILAIRHEGEPLVSNVVDIPLRFGDVMLGQGSLTRINRLRTNPNLLILSNPEAEEATNPAKARISLTILLLTVAAIGLATFLNMGNSIGPLVATFMLGGALAMVLFGCLTMEEAYQSIDWKSVFLIAGMLPLGQAMQSTGTAEILARQIIALAGDGGRIIVLMAIFILAAVLTSVISNAAATVLIVPIAIDTALKLGVNPQPFVMTAVIAASTAFIFPIGHQANIIIFGPGGYRFFDFTKVGIWLNLLLLIVVALVVPIFWPF